jgi:hypothetical protein
MAVNQERSPGFRVQYFPVNQGWIPLPAHGENPGADFDPLHFPDQEAGTLLDPFPTGADRGLANEDAEFLHEAVQVVLDEIENLFHLFSSPQEIAWRIGCSANIKKHLKCLRKWF